MDDGLHIRLFGEFSLSYNGELLKTINTPRLQEILTFLALNCETPLSRRRISFQFWPGSSETQALGNLRNLLYQLRHALPRPDEYIHTDHVNIQWNPRSEFRLDVKDFKMATAAADRASTNQNTTLQEQELIKALSLYRGQLLPDCYSAWIEEPREQLKQEYLKCLRTLIEIKEQKQNYSDAIRFCKQLVQTEPMDESAWRRLINLYALNNNRAYALQSYKECVNFLKQELNISPGPETNELYQRLLSGSKSARYKQSTNKVQPVKSQWPLIGRQTEWNLIQESWREVQHGKSKMAVISGAAGIGKTRLGIDFLNQIKRQGFRTVCVQCTELGRKLPLAPIINCLESQTIHDDLHKLDLIWKKQLVRLIPELVIEFPEVSPPEDLATLSNYRGLFEAISRALTISDNPLLLFIDNLELADADTLTWIDYHFHNKASEKIFIIGTLNNQEPDHQSREPFQKLLEELHQKAFLQQLTLSQLSSEETAELASEIAHQNLTEKVRQQLFKVTAGNPGSLVEILGTEGWKEKIFRKDRKDPAKADRTVLAETKENISSKEGTNTTFYNQKIKYGPRKISFIISITVISILAILFAGNYFSTKASDGRRIAILPFTTLSKGEQNNGFAEGMTDILNNNLARNKNFRVISHNTVARYDSLYTQTKMVANLNLDYLIEGSVEQIANRVRINIQLMNAKTSEYIWSNSYEKEVGDVLIMQAKIAEDIISRIETVFSGFNTDYPLEAPNIDPTAFELYLHGVEEQNKKDVYSLQRSVKLFTQSLTIDSSYANVYGRLALSYILLDLLNVDKTKTQEVKIAIRKALQLDPHLPLAYIASGMFQHLMLFNWKEAESAFQKAIDLNPSSDEAYHEYAQYLMRLARFDEAIETEKQAIALNPVSPDFQSGLGEIYFYKGNYEKAIDELRKALQIDPSQNVVNYWLTQALIQTQKYQQALATSENYSFPVETSEAIKAEILAHTGKEKEAHRILKKLINDWTLHRKGSVDSIYLIYLSLGNKERALYWLQQAFEYRSGFLAYMKVEPSLDLIRNDPRFKAIEQQVFAN